MAAKKTSIIDYSFNIWMSNYPESFHPLDMQRFYRFVHTVKRFSRKKDGLFLREKINEFQKKNGIKLDDKKIDYFCDLFLHLLDFCKEYSYQPYDVKN
jgi:hypothetical protein